MKLLRPGGVLVYSTCTITLAENEEQVAWALTAFPCLQLQPQVRIIFLLRNLSAGINTGYFICQVKLLKQMLSLNKNVSLSPFRLPIKNLYPDKVFLFSSLAFVLSATEPMYILARFFFHLWFLFMLLQILFPNFFFLFPILDFSNKENFE